jgi:hypothetical protein
MFTKCTFVEYLRLIMSGDNHRILMLSIFRDESFEMLSRSRNIQLSQCCRNFRRRTSHDQHNVRISSEQIYQGSELRVSNFHSLKLALGL